MKTRITLSLILVLVLIGCAGSMGTSEQQANKILNASAQIYNAIDSFLDTQVASGAITTEDYNTKILPVLTKAHDSIDAGYAALAIYHASQSPLDLATVDKLITDVLDLITQLQRIKG